MRPQVHLYTTPLHTAIKSGYVNCFIFSFSFASSFSPPFSFFFFLFLHPAVFLASFLSSCIHQVYRYTEAVEVLVKGGAKYADIITKEDEKEKHTSIWQLCERNKEYLPILGRYWTPQNHFRHPTCVKDAIY